MRFTVLRSSRDLPSRAKSKAYLIHDGWNDWYKFQTLYQLIIYDEVGERIIPGMVKIGQANLEPGVTAAPGVRVPQLPATFARLQKNFFSLGQDENYYETLSRLPGEEGVNILQALRDCAYDLNIFENYRQQVVMGESLLRSVDRTSVHGRLHRLARGDAQLTKFHFSFTIPSDYADIEGPRLEFLVEPNSRPPMNIHVLIGRNGVGKSRCLQAMAKAVLTTAEESQQILDIESGSEDSAFAGVIFVSFSIFDRFTLPEAKTRKTRAAHVSLTLQAKSLTQKPMIARVA